MLEYLRGNASERKLRLLCSACCRRIWHLLEATRLQQAVAALECFADGEIDEDSFRAVALETHPLITYRDELFSGKVREEIVLPAYGINRAVNGRLVVSHGPPVFATLRPDVEDVHKALEMFAIAARAARGWEPPLGPCDTERAAQADLIRELFGAPCRRRPSPLPGSAGATGAS
jgi:hypothetical protein